ncbi:MAG: hypothetical protein MJA83_13090, partial [Gammaproteobacteria bacterium]|nr:hypothetical protein [Gammaproteobacteria bacterium]
GFEIVGAGDTQLTATLGAVSESVPLTVNPDSTGVQASLTLLPLDPAQAIYAGANEGRVFIQLNSNAPIEFVGDLDLVFDGDVEEIPLLDCRPDESDTDEIFAVFDVAPDCFEDDGGGGGYADVLEFTDDTFALAELAYSGDVDDDGDFDDRSHIIEIVFPRSIGVPDDIESRVELIVEFSNDDFEILTLDIPVLTDPATLVSFDEGVNDPLTLRPGESIDIPVTVTDAAKNRLDIQYLVDGRPLLVESEITDHLAVSRFFDNGDGGEGEVFEVAELEEEPGGPTVRFDLLNAATVEFDFPQSYDIYRIRDDGDTDFILSDFDRTRTRRLDAGKYEAVLRSFFGSGDFLFTARVLSGESLIRHEETQLRGSVATYIPRTNMDRITRYTVDNFDFTVPVQTQAITCDPGVLEQGGQACSVAWYEFTLPSDDFIFVDIFTDAIVPSVFIFPADDVRAETLLEASSKFEFALTAGTYRLAVVGSDDDDATVFDVLMGVSRPGNEGGQFGIEITDNLENPVPTTFIGDQSLPDFAAGPQTVIMRVLEHRYDGMLRTHDVATFTVSTDTTPGICTLPQTEVLFPPDGTPLYNTFGEFRGANPPSGGGGGGCDCDCICEFEGVHGFSESGETGVGVQAVSGSTGGALHREFQPVLFSATAPSGIDNVEWTNAPADLNEPQSFVVTTDDVNYSIVGDSAYRAIFDADLASLDFDITAACGANTTLSIPLNIQPDPVPAIALLGSNTITMNKGGLAHVDLELTDAGRNIARIEANVLSNEDDERLGSREWVGHFFLNNNFGGFNSRQDGITDRNTLRYRLPLELAPFISRNLEAGAHTLELVVIDGREQSATLEAVLNVLPPALPPDVNVTGPSFRVPAGESGRVSVDVDHLDLLDRVEIIVTEPGGGGSTQVIDLRDDETSRFNDFVVVNMPENVQPDDIVQVSVRAFDINGLSNSADTVVEVGAWGERTVVVSRGRRLGDDLRYTNVIVGGGDEVVLQWDSNNFPVNSLHLESGSSVQVSVFEPINIRETLRIDSGANIRVNQNFFNSPSAVSPFGLHGAAHGGDSSRNAPEPRVVAYGDFREPRFPGGDSRGSSRRQGGGVFDVTVPNLILNGSVNADGRFSFNSSSFLGSGAGGSVIFRSNHVEGTGRITVNGGITQRFNHYEGAGGRIAIHYESYGDGSISISDGLNFEAYSGTPSNSLNHAGAGTVFLKRDGDFGEFEELIIDSGGRFTEGGSTTTLRSVGRHQITAVEPVLGEPNLYRIHVDGAPWQVPDVNQWQLGITELFVILDADNPDSMPYQILDNDESSFVVESTSDLTPFLSFDLQGIIRLDRLATTAGVELYSDDLIYADEFNVEDVVALDNVADVFSEPVPPLADFVLDNDTQLIIGDAVADSVTLRNGAAVTVFGDLNVSGAVTVESGSSLAADDLDAGPVTVEGGSSLAADDLDAGTVTVENGSSLTADNIDAGTVDVTGNSVIETTELATTSLNITDSLVDAVDVDAATVNVIANTLETTLIADVITVTGITVSGNTAGGFEAVLVTGDVNATDMDLTGLAVMNAFEADVDALAINPLNLNITNSLTVGADARIDVSGLGYPANSSSEAYTGPDFTINNTRRYCHAGTTESQTENCTFGRFERARFAGSGGGRNSTTDNGSGGGIVDINADTVTLEGQIIANGINGHGGGGAGGAVHIGTRVFDGAGNITANGGAGRFTSSFNGSGGRISLIVAGTNNFSGTTNAARGSGSAKLAGAGTIYTKLGSSKGVLTVDNLGLVSTERGTPVRGVGRQRITGAQQISAGVWEITVEGTPWRATDTVLDWGVDGLKVDLSADDASTPDDTHTVASNTENTLIINTSNDLLPFVGNDLIGVRELESVVVKGGGQLDFNGDRLSLDNIAGSVLSSGATLIVGQLDGGLFNNLLGQGETGSRLIITDGLLDVTNFTYDNSDVILEIEGALNVNEFTISNGVSLTVDAINADNVVINGGATLASSTINTVFDLSVEGNSTLTAIVPDADALILHPLRLNVGDNLTVEAGSVINVNGKGYPAISTSRAYSGPDFTLDTRLYCHGGQNDVQSSDCTYGRFERARFAGSGGGIFNINANNGFGGGIVDITADVVTLDGGISADGNPGDEGGAGGAIHIDANTVAGDALLSVNGGNASRSTRAAGSGGRISIIANQYLRNGFMNMSARRGAIGRLIGAGTMFLKIGPAKGELKVDNGGFTSTPNGTPVRNVGRHTITDIAEVEPGIWQVSVDDSPWRASDPQFGWGIDGIDVDLSADSESVQGVDTFTVVSNTESALVVEAAVDLTGFIGGDLIGVQELDAITVAGFAELDFGGDRVIVNNTLGLDIDTNSSLFVGQMNGTGFENLIASVSGGGRLVIRDTVVDIDDFSHNNPNVQLEIEGDLNVGVFGVGDGVTLAVGNVAADRAQINSGATLVTNSLTVINNADVIGGGSITAFDPESSAVHPLVISVGGRLVVDKDSFINVDGKGFRAINNQGGNVPPDFVFERFDRDNTRISCHAGIRANSSLDCTYGRYERAQLAGSPGTLIFNNNTFGNPGFGGGVVDISADILRLDGVISANGNTGGRAGGAGGAIHINTRVFDTVGVGGSPRIVSANGGATNSSGDFVYTGSGGRISVIVDQNDFDGTFTAAVDASRGVPSGAGTVFLKVAGSKGELIVDNGGNIAPDNSTPVRSVGRRNITSAQMLDAGVWEITVSGNPWQTPDARLGSGVDGLKVDLSADDAAVDGTDTFPIAGNTENTLIINTTNDLSVFVGGDLIGVQEFESITVDGGAQLDFGGDRVIIENITNSVLGDNTSLAVGQLDSATFENLRSRTPAQPVKLTVRDKVFGLTDLIHANPNMVLAFGRLDLGTLSLENGSSLTVGNLNATGNVSLLQNSLLSTFEPSIADSEVNALVMTIGGDLTIGDPAMNNTDTSTIDVSGKGYPALNINTGFTGPTFRRDVGEGCHAGIAQFQQQTCVFGRLERAQFAGSAGTMDTSNVVGNGFGGGIVDIAAGIVTLNGGRIIADGNSGWLGGAGGAIHIEASELRGDVGLLSVNGGIARFGNSNAGAGGRISVALTGGNSFAGD